MTTQTTRTRRARTLRHAAATTAALTVGALALTGCSNTSATVTPAVTSAGARTVGSMMGTESPYNQVTIDEAVLASTLKHVAVVMDAIAVEQPGEIDYRRITVAGLAQRGFQAEAGVVVTIVSVGRDRYCVEGRSAKGGVWHTTEAGTAVEGRCA